MFRSFVLCLAVSALTDKGGRFQPPKLLRNVTLHPYQRSGVRWLTKLWNDVRSLSVSVVPCVFLSLCISLSLSSPSFRDPFSFPPSLSPSLPDSLTLALHVQTMHLAHRRLCTIVSCFSARRCVGRAWRDSWRPDGFRQTTPSYQFAGLRAR